MSSNHAVSTTPCLRRRVTTLFLQKKGWEEGRGRGEGRGGEGRGRGGEGRGTGRGEKVRGGEGRGGEGEGRRGGEERRGEVRGGKRRGGEGRGKGRGRGEGRGRGDMGEERIHAPHYYDLLLTMYGESRGENFTTFTLLREQQKNPDMCCKKQQQTNQRYNCCCWAHLEASSGHTKNEHIAKLNSCSSPKPPAEVGGASMSKVETDTPIQLEHARRSVEAGSDHTLIGRSEGVKCGERGVDGNG